MRQSMSALLAVGLVALVGLTGCGGAGGPRAGDTVTFFVFDDQLQWTAGQSTSLAVRLRGQGPQEASPRDLSFSGVPGDFAPRGTVAFFSGDEALSSVELTFDHRC
jgi:hypothetical protein